MSRRNAILAALLAVVLIGAGGYAVLAGGSSDGDDRAATTSTETPAPTQTTPVKKAKPSAKAKKPPKKRAQRQAAAPGDVRLKGLRGGGPVVGLADNRPETFRDPRFGSTGIKYVRVAVPYDDVALGGKRRAVQDAYFANARQTGIKPLVSFYRSSRGTRILPTEAQFRRNVRLFRQRYPWVREFSTWNEANFRAQPTGRDPARTAAFYRILRDECSGGRCTVVTCDFRPDGTAQSARWLEAFKRGIGPGRHIWGLAPYVDVNRQSTKLTRDFLARTSGPVWADEVGALNFFGKGVRPDIRRQDRVMAFLVNDYARVSTRLKRIYVYHWRAAAGDRLFDSGLLDVSGRPRPAYYRFLAAIGKRAR